MSERNYFSYRSDPRVPAFDDRVPIALMDAECALCCLGACMIDRLERSGEIRICPVQSVLGQSLMTRYGVRVDNPETWLLLDQGQMLGDFEAMIRVGERSGGWARSLSLLRVVPRTLRNRIYAAIACNRYRWFGRGDLCGLPTATLRARLMSDST